MSGWDAAFAGLAAHALAAAGLAVAVTLLARAVRHPAVVHALWVVVLLKLLIPPFVELAVLPAPAASVPVVLPAGSAGFLEEAAVVAERTQQRAPGSGFFVALAVFAGGSLTLAALAVVRARRFRRRLEAAAEPQEELGARVAELSRRFGLRRPPRLRVVAARVTPMLWPRLGGVELIVPAALADRLSGAELDGVLCHELAHLRRRDHWVRLLELAATVLFWWHPAVWWARRRLRQAEERSCDAWVAHALPGRARDYAEGLLKTLEFLAGARPPLPALGTGISQARTDMKERLKMILTQRTPRPLSTWHRLLIAAPAVVLLAVLPTRADGGGDNGEATAPSAEETSLREQALDLERREVDLRRQLHELEAERRELDHRREMLGRQAELEQLERRARELEASGQTAEAELHRRRQAAIERETELERKRYELERRRAEERISHEIELREKMLRIEELESHRRVVLDAGRESEAARLEKEMARLEAERAMREQRRRSDDQEMKESLVRAELRERLEALERERAETPADRRERLDEEIELLEQKLAEISEDRKLR